MKVHVKEKRLFLQWAVMAMLIAVGAIFAHRLGYAAYLQDDPTHITYVTLGVFALATALCGRVTWRLCGSYDPDGIRKALKHTWFAADLCMYIGLIGTAIGYYIMLKHGNESGEAKEVIDKAFANTSIAIVNTVVGAICGVLVQIQSHYAETAFEGLKPEKEPEPAAETPKDGGS